MRERTEIEAEVKPLFTEKVSKIVIELLLDIRDLEYERTYDTE